MENKAHALAAGLFVLLLGFALSVTVYWLSSDQVAMLRYEITTRESITGLRPQARVNLRGVPVGRVESIEFDPKTPGQVLIALDIKQGTPITRATVATLGYQGLTGLAYLELDDTQAGAPLLQSTGEPAPSIPLRPSVLAGLFERGNSVLAQVEQAGGQVNALLAQENRQALIGAVSKLGDAAQQISLLAKNFDRILDAQLGPQRVSIPDFVNQANKTLRTLDSAAAQTAEAAGQAGVAAAELGRLIQQVNQPEGLSERLGQTAQSLTDTATALRHQTLPQVTRAAQDAAEAAQQIGRLSSRLQEQPQSLLLGAPSSPGPGEPGFVEPSGKR